MRKRIWEVTGPSRLQNGQPPQSFYTAEAEALGLNHWYSTWLETQDDDWRLDHRVADLHEAINQFGEGEIHRIFWTKFQFERRSYVALNLYTNKNGQLP